MVDLSVRFNDQYDLWVTQDLIILLHCLEFIGVIILVGLIVLTKNALQSSKELSSIPTSIIFGILATHALFIIVIRLTLMIVKKEKHVIFRIASAVLVLIITACLFVGRIYAFLFLAPFLLFDLFLYIFAHVIHIADETTVTSPTSKNADIVQLYQDLQNFSGYMLNVPAFINRTTDALRHDNARDQCNIPKDNVSKTALQNSKESSSKPPNNWHESIKVTSSLDTSEEGWVSVDSLVVYIHDKYLGDKNRNEMKLVDGPLADEVVVQIQDKWYAVTKSEIPYVELFKDITNFTVVWNGIKSNNHTQFNLYKLASALRNVQIVGGRPFIDLVGLLTDMNTWKYEPADYTAVCTRYARSVMTKNTVDVLRLTSYIQQDLMINKVKPVEIATALEALLGKSLPNRTPKLVPELDAYEYGTSVKRIATNAPYYRFVDCETLIRKLDALQENQTFLSEDATFDALIDGAGRESEGDGVHTVINVHKAVINVVLTGYGTTTVKQFIKKALMFALYNDDVIDADTVYTQFYTEKAHLKRWVKPSTMQTKTSIMRSEFSFEVVGGRNNSDKTQTIVFHHMNNGELDALKAEFEEKMLLQPDVLSFQWIKKH